MFATFKGRIEGNNIVLADSDIRLYDGRQVLVVVSEPAVENKEASRRNYLMRMHSKKTAGENEVVKMEEYVRELRDDRLRSVT